MRKTVKIFGGVVAGVVLLLLAATVAIKLYLNKERVLGWVIPPLEEKLQRTVTIADVGAGLTGLHLDGLDVRAAGADAALVSTRRVQVRWNPWSLFSGTVDIVEVRLVEPRVQVTRLADGTLDIDDITAAEAQGQAVAPPADPPETTAGGPPVDILVREFALLGGVVSFVDQSVTPQRSYVLDGIDARITEITLDGPIPYQLSANLPYADGGRFHSEGTLNVASKAVDASVGIADVQLTAWNELLQGETRFVGGALEVDVALEVRQARHLRTQGTVALENLALANGESRGAAGDLNLRWRVEADLEAQQARVEELALTVAEQVLQATSSASAWGERPQVEFTLQADELVLDPILAMLPAAPAAEGAEGEAPDADSPATESVEAAAVPPAGVPLDARGNLTIGALRYGDLALENISVQLELEQDQLRLDPTRADLFGGQLEAALGADLASVGPAFDAAAMSSGVEIGALLAGLNPKLKGALTGTSTLELSAEGVGGDLQQLVSAVKLEVKDGKMVSHPLVREFAGLFKLKEYDSLNFYSLRADATTAEGVGTLRSLIFDGSRMQATGKGSVGLASQELDMRLAVALPRQVAKKIVGNPKVLDVLTDEDDWTRVPMRLSGRVDQPSYAVDAAAVEKIAAQLLGDRVEKLVDEKVLEKLPGGAEEKERIEEGLKSLFGR